MLVWLSLEVVVLKSTVYYISLARMVGAEEAGGLLEMSGIGAVISHVLERIWNIEEMYSIISCSLVPLINQHASR